MLGIDIFTENIKFMMNLFTVSQDKIAKQVPNYDLEKEVNNISATELNKLVKLFNEPEIYFIAKLTDKRKKTLIDKYSFIDYRLNNPTYTPKTNLELKKIVDNSLRIRNVLLSAYESEFIEIKPIAKCNTTNIKEVAKYIQDEFFDKIPYHITYNTLSNSMENNATQILLDEMIKTIQNKLFEKNILLFRESIKDENEEHTIEHNKLIFDNISGFVLNYDVLPIIIIQKEHQPARQIFTIIHELAHLVTDDKSSINSPKLDSEKERFCNSVASEFLLPASFLEDFVDAKNQKMRDKTSLSKANVELIISSTLNYLPNINSIREEYPRVLDLIFNHTARIKDLIQTCPSALKLIENNPAILKILEEEKDNVKKECGVSRVAFIYALKKQNFIENDVFSYYYPKYYKTDISKSKPTSTDKEFGGRSSENIVKSKLKTYGRNAVAYLYNAMTMQHITAFDFSKAFDTLSAKRFDAIGELIGNSDLRIVKK